MNATRGQPATAPEAIEGGKTKMPIAQKQAAPMPELDEKGYLTQVDTWTPAVAEALAKDEVPEGRLTEDHWKVIIYLRQYYLDIGCIPAVRILSRRTGFTLSELKKMFPNGLANGACKIAGIPDNAIIPSFLYP
ncbi:MAG: TusE/DsrC/DsvC family sulfur relay protein [Dehalococcoidia bacterium]